VARAIPLGWKQLVHRRGRLAVALAGIAFAVILILMQLGFRASLLESAVRYHERLRYDIALFSADSLYIVQPVPFSIHRLYQVLGLREVAEVVSVYAGQAQWENPYSHEQRSVFVLGFDPASDVLDAPGVRESLPRIARRDAVLFDALSRPEHGPIAARLRAGEPVSAEVNERRVDVVGLFEMGTSFGIDASLLTSDDNFLRLFPSRARDQIDLGLVRLRPGADPVAARDEMRALLPRDVLVLTRADFIARELAYWNATTPIGYVFGFGVIVGVLVGAIIVYQILFADVSDHLPEYATLKAMGYSSRAVSWVVMQQAVALAVLGYVPGVLVCLWLYRTAGAATRLPMELSWQRGVGVLAVTIAMSAVSGLVALRKVRSLDPAEVF
jgi:DevC protein